MRLRLIVLLLLVPYAKGQRATIHEEQIVRTVYARLSYAAQINDIQMLWLKKGHRQQIDPTHFKLRMDQQLRFDLSDFNAEPLTLLQLGIAQISHPVQLGPVVENVRFEKGSDIAVASIANVSGKDVTGFNLSIEVTYQDGRQSSYERLVDLLPRMLSYQNQELSDNGTLHPGDRWEERLDLPSHKGASNTAIAVSVKLDVAAYSDHTADVENEPALLRLASVRHNRALADQRAAEIMSAAAADSVTPDPTGMALTQLRAVLEQARRKKGEHELEVELMEIIANLESQRSDTSRSDLRSYATRKNADVEILSSHVLFRRSK